jgi:hypothetical protein
MQDLVDALENSLRLSANTPYTQNCQLMKQLKTVNSSIIMNTYESGTIAVIIQNIKEIASMYIWTTRCCEEPNVVAESLNTMHVVGLLFCKCAFVLVEQDKTQYPTSMTLMFDDNSKLHVSSISVMELDYKTLSRCINVLQHEWRTLIISDKHEIAIRALILCIARFGSMLLHSMQISTLNDLENREKLPGRDNEFRPSSRCTRSIITTCMVMIRSYVIIRNALVVRHEVLKSSQVDEIIRNDIKNLKKNPDEYCDIDVRIMKHLLQLKSTRVGIPKMIKTSHNVIQTGISTPDMGTVGIDEMWDHLSLKLGVQTLGDPPRKMSTEMVCLLQDICVFFSTSDTPEIDVKSIPTACIRVVYNALKYYYVVPSGDRFQQISLIENVLPGQRLNYSFDYQFFDTGQLSQVVYLYNPIHKAIPSPNTVDDWKSESVAGPISAIIQLVPELEVFLEDSEDPLGILKQGSQILKPADYTNSNQVVTPMKRWRLIVNYTGAFLVDTEKTQIYFSETQEHVQNMHHIMILLCFFVLASGMTTKIALVALNSAKLSM